jgi:HEAT repeat protein
MRRASQTARNELGKCKTDAATPLPRMQGRRHPIWVASMAVGIVVIASLLIAGRTRTPDFRTMDVVALAHQLATGDTSTRRLAAAAMAQLGAKALPAVEAIGAALNDPDLTVCNSAGIALTKMGPAAVPTLINELSVSDLRGRRSAAAILGLLGADAAVAVTSLITALHDPDEAVVFNSAQALAKIGAPAVPALIGASRDSEPSVRLAAVNALGEMGPAAIAAVAAIRERLDDDCADVCAVAAVAFVGVLHDDVTLLAAALDDERSFVRQQAVSALGDHGPNAVIAADGILGLLDDSDVDVRCQSAIALGRIKPMSSIAILALIERLNDPSLAVRQTATEALGNYGRHAQSAAPKLFELLTHPSPMMRERAGAALEKIVADSIGHQYASRLEGYEPL